MANKKSNDSNLPAALRNDFLTVPTDAELANLQLPDNTDLPYADEVQTLFSVTARTVKHNVLTTFVSDSMSFGSPEDARRERDLIYQAYERVTGHDDLDPPEPLNRQGENQNGTDNSFTYNTYAVALHNGLVTFRKSELLEGASLYHMTRRVVTYLQDVAPNSYLGSLAGGKWWLAPDCYHIVVYHGRRHRGPNPAPPPYADIPIIGDAHLTADPVCLSLYGTDRGLDGGRFDAAQFTFHWINIQFYTYADDTKTGEDADKSDHWGLVIRHAGTNTGYYFDSMFSGEKKAEQTRLLRLVETAINRWLSNSNKTQIRLLPGSVDQPVQRNISGKAGLWQCGVHTIANVIAFIRCGRLGWHNVPTWSAPDITPSAREKAMVNQIKVSLHSLMGLRLDTKAVKDEIIDTTKFSNWKKPATKTTGRAYKTGVTQQTGDTGNVNDTDQQEVPDQEEDTDTQAIETNLDSLRQEVASMKTDLVTTLRQELVTVVQDQLCPVLQEELQKLNSTGDTSTTTSQPPDMKIVADLRQELITAIGDELRPIRQELQSLNQKVGNTSQQTGLTAANLREELATVVQDQLLPVLQAQMQTLNQNGGNSNTTSQPPDLTAATLRQELGAIIQEEVYPILQEERQETAALIQDQLHPVLQQLQNMNTTSQPPGLTAATLHQELVAVIGDQLRSILQQELQILNLQGGNNAQQSDLTTANLCQELAGVIQEQLRPVLQALQQELRNLGNLPGANTTSSSTNPPPGPGPELVAREASLAAREAALAAREQAFNPRETLLNARENDLKRKLDELEGAGDGDGDGGPNNKKQKTNAAAAAAATETAAGTEYQWIPSPSGSDDVDDYPHGFLYDPRLPSKWGIASGIWNGTAGLNLNQNQNQNQNQNP